MLDFSSALYLGLRHPSRSLAPWDRLTTGTPAALGEPPAAGRVAAALAGLQGSEAAVLARSTLHAFLDCFAVLGGPARPVLVDGGAYPIARWGRWRPGPGRPPSPTTTRPTCAAGWRACQGRVPARWWSPTGSARAAAGSRRWPTISS